MRTSQRIPTINANTASTAEANLAKAVRDEIYLSTGAYLEITTESTAANLIVIKKVNDGSFTAKVEGGKLTISYTHENILTAVTESFLDEIIRSKDGLVNLTGELWKKDTSIIYYDDYGAVGDGKTDDYAAICRAHEAANEGGQTVMATPGKTYYMKSVLVDGTYKSIKIKTNVIWTGASFIIDDSGIKKNSTNNDVSIFHVAADNDRSSFKITNKETLAKILGDGISVGTTKIELPGENIENWDGEVMLVLYNSSHKVYRRRSYSGYKGDSMQELIILDKDGNVSEETPVTFDFFKLSQATVYRVDKSRAITITGGKITTIASRADTGYITRNLYVTRSYTTIIGLEHYVEGELELYNQVDENGNVKNGAPYNGFFNIAYCTNVTMQDCVLTGRRYYDTGTYEFSAKMANKVMLVGCTQSNFWVTVDKEGNITPADEDTPGAVTSMSSVTVKGKSLKICWGSGGTNYCKNIEYINSTISRFDAHAGVYNGKIIGCTINGMELTGGGTLLIENTKWFSYGTGSVANCILYLRNDYGSSWNGEIKIKNFDAYFTTKKENDSYLFYHSYSNWYFGHTSVFPSIEIDDLKCYSIATRELLDEGYALRMTNGTHISETSKMHLAESHKKSNYSILDADGDGYVDEPRYDRDLDGKIDEACDLDGDGNIGNTSILVSEAKASASNIENGTYHPTSYVNLNIVKPPEYVKILNNTGKGSFTLRVKNTAGTVSDGGYYDNEERYGGFFGDTKFYYSETEYFVGTNQVGQTETNSFYFYN